ncbi:hypothetical protein [Desulfovibrio sp. JC010]|uniref:hypothetical protein n=1 Tax=Desulfovibrio sp. JC010 TaxID=2593641 RepID=UPI0013D71834|nr:hypothetical protein [Desulfovibrio sp. JC010]NDV28187.1 hypothetical protein [Desulfovibrio sp. JC010]
MNIKVISAVFFVLCLCVGTVFYPLPARSGDAIHKVAYKGQVEKMKSLIAGGVDAYFVKTRTIVVF